VPAWAAAGAAAVVAAVADGGERAQTSEEIEMKLHNRIIAAALSGAFAALCSLPAASQATASPPAKKSAVTQKTFASAEEAVKALTDAVRAKSVDGLLAVVGPSSSSWLFTGDMVADANDWKRFLEAYDRKHKLEPAGEGRMVLDVGDDDWPFPAPLVKRGDKWAFDANAGKQELLNRRVGRNELDAMQTLLAIVDAEREYAATDADGNGFADYARKFRSSPGKKDGLFWPTADGAPPSPLGPLVAVAAKEGYGKKAGDKASTKDTPQAYHGYYYRILTSQGKDAPGGAYDYLVGDKLLGGFAVVAYPATYRVSGVTTFLVNHEGVVYEKDLGPQTGTVAAAMTRFNPDATWRKAQ
jgi:hypothetical protein